MFPSILIVDDEPAILQSLRGLLADEGFEVLAAVNGYEALKAIDREAPDLVLLDLWMPGIDGLETLKEIKRGNPHTPVIIVTGHGNIETAVKATKLGAFDLIEKPLSIDRLIVAIQNALNFRRLEEENRYLRRKMLEKSSINGTSPAVRQLKQEIARAAAADAWVLITGENGTGKELVARTLHQLSPRAEHPMVDVACASVPEGRVEHELFGHERGSAGEDTPRQIGRFELAHRGTLFFDEIGDMSPKMQGVVLRALAERRIRRVGGGRDIPIDVRVIAATNKDLAAEIRAGRFREDLYYRVAVYPLRVPPLRERVEDIPVLTEIFLGELAAGGRGRARGVTGEALALLQGYPWPGNIRELKNLLERLSIRAAGEWIEAEAVRAALAPAAGAEAAAPGLRPYGMAGFREARRAFEREYLARRLAETGRDLKETARRIGVGRSYLSRKIRDLGL